MKGDPLNQCVPVLSELLSLQGLPTETDKVRFETKTVNISPRDDRRGAG